MKKAITKRQLIIQTATALYSKNGIAETTLADVAKKAKISAQLVQYHFSSLEELHHECTAAAGKSLSDYTTEKLLAIDQAPARETLAAYIRITFDWAREHTEFFQLMLFMYYRLSVSEHLAEVNSGVRKIGRQRIENMIYKGIEEKAWNPASGTPVSALAIEIQGLLTGQVILSFTETDLEFDRMVELTQKAVLRILK